MKERLDVLLVKRNLADSREKAKALIMCESNARAQRQKSSFRSRYCGGMGYCIRRK